MSIRNACAVGVIILNDRKEVLLQRRGDDNTWCIPGGGMEIGESTQETAIREVKEETGLDVTNLVLFNVFSGKSQYHKYPDGNEYYFINIVYITGSCSGELQVDFNETLDLKYYNLKSLPENISNTNVPILSELQARISEYM